MHPHLLLRPSTVRAHPQNILHLRIAHEKNVPRDEEPDPLAARRARQAAAVRPHLSEITSFAQRQSRRRSAVQANVSIVVVGEALVGRRDGGVAFDSSSGAVGAGERRLGEEGRVAEDSRVDTNGQHGALGAVAVNMHEVQFGFGAVDLHTVVGGCVDMPADEVDGFVDAVVFEGEVRGVEVDGAVDCLRAFGAAGFGEAEGWAVAPVVELAGHVACVVEAGEVGGTEALLEVERDWGLLGAGLAELVVGGEHAPVLRLVV